MPLENLSEEEIYLYTILSDTSGIDLAELTWFAASDEESDGCWRARPYQWPWFRCTDMKQIDQMARDLGKSLSIKLRAFAFPFLWPGQEMVITAPELNHLEPIVQLVEEQFYATRLGREMMLKKRGGVTHRPFMMKFANQSRIMGKIPQKDGRGVKGCVVEGTHVLTADGHKPVEDVVVGELIYTHENRWMPVLAIDVDRNDCYSVSGMGSYPMQVSCDHRFFGLDSKERGAGLYFETAEDLLEFDFKWASPTKFAPLAIPGLKFQGTANRFEMTEDFWWLVGRYLADGYLSENKKNGKERKVHWVVHPKDQADVTLRLDNLGIHHFITERSHSSANVVCVSSAAWNRWLSDHFGRTCSTKRIPGFCLGMDGDHRNQLLEGYLMGDGHWNAEKARWEAGSASKALALGNQMLAQSLGYRVLCSMSVPKVSEINRVKLKKKPQVSWRIYITSKEPDDVIDGFIMSWIREVDAIGKKKVYNLISDDHSYVTGSVVSHNIHPVWLEMDEAQDYPHPGWVELNPTLKKGIKGAVWRAHGVTRGVQDDFYKRSADPNTEWTVHKMVAMNRPSWTDEERQSAISEYGSRDDPDYRRNILGEHGDATNPIFVLHRLMKVVDDNVESDYNQEEYNKTRITAEILNDFGGDIEAILEQDIPVPPAKYKAFWGGMDVGFTIDPSEILVFAEHTLTGEDVRARKATSKKYPDEGLTSLRLVARVSLVRIRPSDQVRAIAWLFKRFPGMRAFSMDATGNGLPLFQDMQDAAAGYLDKVKGYKFGSKILVGFDDRIEVDEMLGDPVEDAGIQAIVEVYATDLLRKAVDQGRLWLPFDDSLLASFQGQTQTVKTELNQYGKRQYSKGNFHVLDAARMAILGWKQHSIEKLVNERAPEPVIDMPVYDIDW